MLLSSPFQIFPGVLAAPLKRYFKEHHLFDFCESISKATRDKKNIQTFKFSVDSFSWFSFMAYFLMEICKIKDYEFFKKKWTENKIKDVFTCVNIKIILFTLVAIVLFVSQSYRTRVICVALLLHWCHSCCGCDALVFLVSRLCCNCVAFVALVLLESDTRVVR